MSQSHWLRRRWKLILNLVTLVALIVLVYAIRRQLGDTFHNLTRVNSLALMFMIPIEALNYHAQARLYGDLFRIVGNDLKYGFLYRASLELNFVNHVFPSGGVTGISFFSVRLRKKNEITATKATLIHIMKIGLTFISFEILTVIGLLALAIAGRASNLTILVAASLSTLMIVATVLFVYVVGSRQRINSFFTSVTTLLNSFVRFFWPGNPEPINITAAKVIFNEFHDNYQLLKDNVSELKVPFWYAFLANVTEVAVLYAVYIAFGEYVNIGAVILAYAVANFAGFVSVLPGGIGIYEAIMTAVLATTGISPSVSLPVTVMYRVLNTLIQLPPGYYFYHKTISQGDVPRVRGESKDD